MGNRGEARSVRRALLVVLALAWIGVGAWLPQFEFGAQIVIEDEWHALHKIVAAGAYDIFTSFGNNDHGIPLARYDRWLMALGTVATWRRDRGFVIHVATLVAAFAVLVGARRAIWIGHPLVSLLADRTDGADYLIMCNGIGYELPLP